MIKQLDFTEAKQATISKWKKVLELLQDVQRISSSQCEFCTLRKQNGYDCPGCPVKNICGHYPHSDTVHSLHKTIYYATKLCEEIAGIEETDSNE